MTGQKLNDEAKTIDFDHFTVTQVFLLLLLMILMMIERMLYRTRKNSSWDNQQGPNAQQHGEWSKHALTFKFVIYVCLIVYVHVWSGFILPAKQGIKLSHNKALLINYLLWVLHFVFAAL